MSKMDELFDQMLDATCEEMAGEKETSSEDVKAKEEAKNVLEQFLSHIRSKKFVMQCKSRAKAYNLDYKIVKNAFVRNILGKIADVLNLTITITAEIITYVVEFITALIAKIVNFTVGACSKLIQLLTLNCGTQPA